MTQFNLIIIISTKSFQNEGTILLMVLFTISIKTGSSGEQNSEVLHNRAHWLQLKLYSLSVIHHTALSSV